jgi:hypothetical protein
VGKCDGAIKHGYLQFSCWGNHRRYKNGSFFTLVHGKGYSLVGIGMGIASSSETAQTQHRYEYEFIKKNHGQAAHYGS